MPAPVRINFRAGGVREVQRAFQTIEQLASRSAREQVRTVGAVAVARERGEKKFQQSVIKSARESAQAIDQELRARERAEARKGQATERWERRRLQIMQSSARAEEAMAQRSERAAKRVADVQAKAADHAARAAERTAHGEARAGEIWQRRRLQIMRNSAGPDTAHEAAEARTAAAASRVHAREQWAGGFGRRVVGAASNAIRTVGMVAGSLAGFAGGFTAVDAVRGAIDDQRAAQVLSNQAYVPGERERPDPKKIFDRATEVSRFTGTDRKEVMAGLSRYQALSNDFEGGMANLGSFAKLAKASGSKLEDVMGAAGYLRVQNPDLKPAAMMDMLRNVVAQGKLGSIELPDLAKHMGTITATSAGYSGEQADVQRQLLGLTQLAGRTSGSPEEAATSVSRLFSDVSKHRQKFRDAGVKIEDAHGNLLPPEELLPKIFAHTKGNLGKIQAMGINERSFRLFEALTQTHRGAGGGEKGDKAVAAEIKRYTNGKYSQGDVDTDFAAIMATDAEALQKAMRDLEEQVGTALVPQLRTLIPEIVRLTPSLVRLAEGAGKIAEYFIKNPFEGMGAIVLASIVKDLAGAGIGAGVAAAIKAMIAGPTAGALAGGVATVFGAVTAGAAIGGTVGVLASEGFAQYAHGRAEGAGDAQIALAEAQGAKSPEERAKAAEHVKEALAREQNSAAASPADLLMGILAAVSGQGKEFNAAIGQEKAIHHENVKQLEASAARLAKALDGAAGTVEKAGSRTDPNNPTRTTPQGKRN